MNLQFKVIEKVEEKISYLDRLSLLHQRNLKGSLTFFGYDFIKRLYKTLLSEKNTFFVICFDASERHTLLGYVLFTKEKNNYSKKFVLKNFLFLFFFFLSNFYRINFYKNIFDICIETSSNPIKDTQTELLTIVTINKRLGIGSKLIQKAENYLKKNFYNKYFTRTEKINQKAFKFYLKNKFSLISENKNSFFFIKTI